MSTMNPPHSSPPPAAESTTLSVISLVLGIVSLVAGFTFVVPIAGLVCGILALNREPRSRTMAVWGVVLNSVTFVLGALLVVATVIFGLALIPFALLGH